LGFTSTQFEINKVTSNHSFETQAKGEKYALPHHRCHRPCWQIHRHQLRTIGQDVRIVTRDVRKAPVGVEAVQGDFTKGDLPSRAFEDVNRVFLFPAQGGVDAFLK